MPTPDDCRSLDDVRAAIDAIDREIVVLLGRRATYVRAAAKFKTSEAAVRAPDRVRAMLVQRRDWATEERLSPDFVEALFRSVVDYFVGGELRQWHAQEQAARPAHSVPRSLDERWIAVDRYINDTLLPADPRLDGVLAANHAAGLPPIDVTPSQGQFLCLLARALGGRRILEIGTLGGYSTIWLARGLGAGGQVVTLELNPHHAAVARGNFERAGVTGLIDLREGPALETLKALRKEAHAPFDLVFIDADKPPYAEYLEAALALSRPGTLILADNVVREGAAADPASPDPAVQGVRRFTDAVARHEGLMATTIQTVSPKGYDGFTAILVMR